MSDLFDSNSMLYRDYGTFLGNQIQKIPLITKKWSDFTVSEPDSIFLSNVCYVTDLLSYSIDFRFFQTSLRFTDNENFLASLFVMTGSDLPDYQETYFLDIKSYPSLDNGAVSLREYEVITDSTGLFYLTALENAEILPGTQSSVKVMPGFLYASSLKGVNNLLLSAGQQEVNDSSVFSDKRKSRIFSIAEIYRNKLLGYNYGLNEEKYFAVLDLGKDSYVFLPSSENDLFFFSSEKDNIMHSGSPVSLPAIKGEAIFRKEQAGSKASNITDRKLFYINSLRKIKTVLNNSDLQEYLKSDDIEYLSLSYENRDNKIILDSFIDYAKGYVDFRGNFDEQSSLAITYDYFRKDNPSQYMTNTLPDILIEQGRNMNYSVDLLLPAGCQIKANSFIFELTTNWTKRTVYYSDFDSKIKTVKGIQVSETYKYILKDGKPWYEMPFVLGKWRKTSDKVTERYYDTTYHKEMERELTVCEFFFVSASETADHQKISFYSDDGSVYPNEEGMVYLRIAVYKDNDPIYILWKAGNISSRVYGIAMPDGIIYKLGSVFDEKGNFTPRNELNSPLGIMVKNGEKYLLSLICRNRLQGEMLSIKSNADNTSFTKEYLITNENKVTENFSFGTDDGESSGLNFHSQEEMQDENIYEGNYPHEGKIEDDMPKAEGSIDIGRIMIDISEGNYKIKEVFVYYDDKVFDIPLDANVSSKDFYNSFLSTDILYHSLDLYDTSIKLEQIKKKTIDISAKVFLIPNDLTDKAIEDAIKENLETFFASLSPGGDLFANALLSKIIHAHDYIVYAEMETPSKDINIESSEMAVLGKLNLEMKRSDNLLF